MGQDISRHNEEIRINQGRWDSKSLLRRVYREFHKEIAARLSRVGAGPVVEIGSGIGAIRETIPDCVRTDLFRNPWIDRLESAYRLSFSDASVSDFILIDVFHHLRHPGLAFREIQRALRPGGRVILLEPDTGLLGIAVFTLLHHEPLCLWRAIEWEAPPGFSPEKDEYYAAQGNAHRIFFARRFRPMLEGFRLLERRRMSALPWLASGGYSPLGIRSVRVHSALSAIGRALDLLPWLFSTRLLAVLEKPLE
ncbi:MAG: methyltransferase domain-containing protein [Planctomycetota bacterium]